MCGRSLVHGLRYTQSSSLRVVAATFEPEPSEAEREAILTALRDADEGAASEWATAALLEGVERDEPDP